MGFGLGVTGFTMTDYLAKSADRIAIGFFFGAGPLGYFQNAFTITERARHPRRTRAQHCRLEPEQAAGTTSTALKRAWERALSTLSFFSALAFAILAVVGQDFVVLLLGQKWAPAGPLLCIFAVRGIAQSIERTMGWLHVAAGRADRWMRWGVYAAIVQLLALVAGLPFGVTGVAIAYAIAMFALFVPALVYSGRPVGIHTSDVLRAVGPQMIGALVAVTAGFLVQFEFLAESLAAASHFRFRTWFAC